MQRATTFGCTNRLRIKKTQEFESALVYSTYVGGYDNDAASGIAVDSSGNVYVTGRATSADFPAVRPLPLNQGQAFILKLNADGSALTYSMRFGGNPVTSVTDADAIAVDAIGNAYVTGGTDASDFPLLNSGPGEACSTNYSPFVTEFNATASSLVYSKCLGNLSGSARAIAVDLMGSAYITGQFSFTGLDAFVSKLNATGSVIYKNRLGGSGDDMGFGIAVDNGGSVYVTGSTTSNDFPTTNNAFQPALAPGSGGSAQDAFVTRLNPAGSIVFSTYLGGNGSDSGQGIAVDSSGNAYVSGSTLSSNFPIVNPIQALPGGDRDVFVAELNATGSSLAFSTYLGGDGTDGGRGIALDAGGTSTFPDRRLHRTFQTSTL